MTLDEQLRQIREHAARWVADGGLFVPMAYLFFRNEHPILMEQGASESIYNFLGRVNQYLIQYQPDYVAMLDCEARGYMCVVCGHRRPDHDACPYCMRSAYFVRPAPWAVLRVDSPDYGGTRTWEAPIDGRLGDWQDLGLVPLPPYLSGILREPRDFPLFWNPR